MDPGNHEQTELLRNIWQEMKALGVNLGGRIDAVRTELSTRIDAVRTELGAHIDATNLRLDETNERLDHVDGRLGRVEGVLRDLAQQQLVLTRFVKNSAERHEEAIADLQERVERLETKGRPEQ